MEKKEKQKNKMDFKWFSIEKREPASFSLNERRRKSSGPSSKVGSIYQTPF
jgi:hypothetical protein